MVFFRLRDFFRFWGAMGRTLPNACLRHDPGTDRWRAQHDCMGNDRRQPSVGIVVGQDYEKPKEAAYSVQFDTRRRICISQHFPVKPSAFRTVWPIFHLLDMCVICGYCRLYHRQGAFSSGDRRHVNGNGQSLSVFGRRRLYARFGAGIGCVSKIRCRRIRDRGILDAYLYSPWRRPLIADLYFFYERNISGST